MHLIKFTLLSRLSQDVYQTAKVSKILQLMEKGDAARFKNKCLDEIDIDMEDIELDVEENIEENTGKYFLFDLIDPMFSFNRSLFICFLNTYLTHMSFIYRFSCEK